MPFLRVIRDKRGYETTYLMHWFAEGGRQRSRILYAFRGPVGVRACGVPLEAATTDYLEAQYPEIHFDWKAVVADAQLVEASQEQRRRRPKREESQARPPAEHTAARPSREAVAPAPQTTGPSRMPTALQGDSVEDRLAFLARTYPEVRERVERRVADASRREALLLLAERLNPEGWTDADREARMAQAAEALERLVRVLSRRRRRGRAASGAPATGGGTSQAPKPVELVPSADGEPQ